MTKEYLHEYRELQKEIKRLQGRIAKLSDSKYGVVADIVKGSSTEFPYTEHSILVEGFDGDKKLTSINRFQELLTKRVDKSMAKTVQIAEFICEIESVKIRTIFEYRYYDLLTWQQIAFKIGCTSEAYPRNIHDKYLGDVRLSTKETC